MFLCRLENTEVLDTASWIRSSILSESRHGSRVSMTLQGTHWIRINITDLTDARPASGLASKRCQSSCGVIANLQWNWNLHWNFLIKSFVHQLFHLFGIDTNLVTRIGMPWMPIRIRPGSDPTRSGSTTLRIRSNKLISIDNLQCFIFPITISIKITHNFNILESIFKFWGNKFSSSTANKFSSSTFSFAWN